MYNTGMENRKKRIYVDTSAVIGKFDEDESRRQKTEMFWDAVRNGKIVAMVSDVLEGELKSDTLAQAQRFFAGLPESQIELVTAIREAKYLAGRYIAEKVVGESSRNDCVHVALATICRADGIVSWNLRDMVKRMDKYNGVNVALGYPKVKILTPDQYKEI